VEYFTFRMSYLVLKGRALKIIAGALLAAILAAVVGFIASSPSMLLPAAVALLALVVAYRNLHHGILVTVFLLPVTPRAPELFGTANYSPAELFFLGVAAAWILKISLRSEVNLRRTPLDAPLLLFLVLTVLSFILNFPPILPGSLLAGSTSLSPIYSLKTVLNTLEWVLAYHLVVNNASKKQVMQLIKVSLIALTLVSVYGMWEFASRWGEKFLRAEGTFNAPNMLAAYILLTAPLALTLYLKDGKMWAGGITVLSVIAMFLTHSRAGLLILISVIVLILLKQRFRGAPARKPSKAYAAAALLLALLAVQVVHDMSSNPDYKSLTKPWGSYADVLKENLVSASFPPKQLVNLAEDRPYYGSHVVKGRDVEGKALTDGVWGYRGDVEQEMHVFLRGRDDFVVMDLGYPVVINKILVFNNARKPNAADYFIVEHGLSNDSFTLAGLLDNSPPALGGNFSHFNLAVLDGLNFTARFIKVSPVLTTAEYATVNEVGVYSLEETELVDARAVAYYTLLNRFYLKSSSDRPHLLRNSVTLLARDPLVGVGPGRFRSVYARAYGGGIHHSHNAFLQVAFERGLPSLAIFLWLIYSLFKVTTSIGGKSSKALRAGLLAGFACFILYGLTDYVLYSQKLALAFWMIAGAAASISKNKGK